MHMLVENIENVDKITASYPSDFFEWKGMTFTPDGDVETINWPALGLKGEMDFAWLPDSVTSFDIAINRDISGTIMTATLPKNLKFFGAHSTQLSGSVDFTALPGPLRSLQLNDCAFSGTINVTQLPREMNDLYLQMNKFSGSVRLINLPETIRWIRMDGNKLKGLVVVGPIPTSLMMVSLVMNSIDGVVGPKGAAVTDRRIVWEK